MITNEISKKFINDKVNELVSGNNIATIKKIDDFLSTGLNQITEELINKLKEARNIALTETEKTLTERATQKANLQSKMKDYEEDLTAIESLKTFKRKSKVFN